MRRLLVADSKLGDKGEETRLGVAWRAVDGLDWGEDIEEAAKLAFGLGEWAGGGSAPAAEVPAVGNAGEAADEEDVRDLDMCKVGESLAVDTVKVGEVVSGSCSLLDIDWGEGVSNWVVSCTCLKTGSQICKTCGIYKTTY